MRSNRTIQTIVQAITLVLVAAIYFRMPKQAEQAGAAGGRPGAPQTPSEADIKRRYRQWFGEFKDDLNTKATLLSVGVDGISQDGTVAHVRLKINFRWEAHNINYAEGPLRGAPGRRGDEVTYTQVFRCRYWGEARGWDFEEHRKPPIIQ